MPIYEYVCVDCQQKFEMRRGFSQADDPATCPECGGQHVRRMLSTFVAFTSSDGGTRTAVAGAGGGCSTCATGTCSTCGIARG